MFRSIDFFLPSVIGTQVFISQVYTTLHTCELLCGSPYVHSTLTHTLTHTDTCTHMHTDTHTRKREIERNANGLSVKLIMEIAFISCLTSLISLPISPVFYPIDPCDHILSRYFLQLFSLLEAFVFFFFSILLPCSFSFSLSLPSYIKNLVCYWVFFTIIG